MLRSSMGFLVELHSLDHHAGCRLRMAARLPCRLHLHDGAVVL